MVYEICYLIGESKELELDSIKKGVEEIVVSKGGVFLDGEFQEKRKLAYEIKKDVRGTFVARRFEIKKTEEESNAVNEIIREMNLNGSVSRFLIVNAEELPELKSNYQAEAKAEKREENGRGRRPYSRERKEETKPKVEIKKEEVKKEEVKEEVKKEASEPKAEKEEVAKEEAKKEEKKEESKEEKKTVKASKKKTEKKDSEADDIDKKLDELLNI